MRLRPGSRDPLLSLWLLFACLYALSIGAGFYSSDGEVMFHATTALVERGTWSLSPDLALPQIVPGTNGRFYSKYDPGLPLLAAPFYAVGEWVGRINHAHRTTLAAIFALLLPALAGASTVAALYALARPAGDERRARYVAQAAGLATPLWVYGRELFAEALLAFALTGAVSVLTLTSGSNRRSNAGALLAGLLFGLGVLTRAALLIYALPLAALIAWPRAGRTARTAARRLLLFGLGVLPFGLALAWHNSLRFGDPLTFGYAGERFSTPVWRGVVGLLFSPDKSVFLYAPPLALSVLLWPRFRRAQPALGAFLALAWAVALPFYGAWWAWGGGWSWGPRLLVPLLPLSCLPLLSLPDARRWRWAALGLIALGVAIQLLGVLTDVTPHYASLTADGSAQSDQAAFSLADAPPLSAFRHITRGQTDPLAAFHLAAAGLPPTWSLGVPALLLAGFALGVLSVWRPRLPRVHGRAVTAPER